MVPAALTIAVAAADTVDTPVNVIVGDEVYPEPGLVTVIMPTALTEIPEVAIAPLPPPPINLIPGMQYNQHLG